MSPLSPAAEVNPGADTVRRTDKLAELGKRKLSVDTQDALAKFYGNDF